MGDDCPRFHFEQSLQRRTLTSQPSRLEACAPSTARTFVSEFTLSNPDLREGASHDCLRVFRRRFGTSVPKRNLSAVASAKADLRNLRNLRINLSRPPLTPCPARETLSPRFPPFPAKSDIFGRAPVVSGLQSRNNPLPSSAQPLRSPRLCGVRWPRLSPITYHLSPTLSPQAPASRANPLRPPPLSPPRT